MSRLDIIGPEFVWDLEQIRDNILTRSDTLGLDTEFSSLNYWEPDWELRTVQLATGDHTYVFDVQRDDQSAIVAEILDATQQFISHDQADVIAIWRHFGIDISDRNLDTKVVAQLLWPGETVPHDLKTLVAQFVGPELQKAEDALHVRFRELLGKSPEAKLSQKMIGEGFRVIDTYDPVFVKYAGADAHYVRQLFMVLEPKMYETGVHKAWENECKIRAIATRMRIRGMKVNLSEATQLHGEWSGRLTSALDAFQTQYGCSARSTQKVASLLLKDGVKLTKRTKPSKTHPTGQWALGKEIVKELADEYPDNEKLKLLVEVSENLNVSTFLTTLLSYIDKNGRVHPSISTLGTVTGRWSVTEPAVQTVSGTNPCRSVFVPSTGRFQVSHPDISPAWREERHVQVSADLGQIEPRIAVGLAEERNLIPDLIGGYDVYSSAAAIVFGPDYTPAQRKKIKRVILGTLYAAGVATLVKQAKYLDGWSDANPAAVGEVRNQWKKAAPEIESYSKHLQTLPIVTLESGRYVPQDEQRRYKAINSACQGTARDVLMERLIRISERYDEYLVMTFHDEILLDVPVTELQQVVTFVRGVMEAGYAGIPTPTDIEIFPEHWSGAGMSLEDYLGGNHGQAR